MKSRTDSIINASKRKLRYMLAAHIFWVSALCILGAWWVLLIQRQAARIAELETSVGISAMMTESNWHRTNRMLFWESGTFFLIFLISTLFLFWIYWRDMQRSRGIQAFFASVTHELRTPLTSIRLQAESIADSADTDSSLKPLVNRLLEDTVRLESQVDRTLELARVEGGGPVFVQSLELKPWLERMVRTWKDHYGERVSFALQLEDVSIEADPTALQVILKNLIENSIRHSKREKTRITLSTESRESEVVLSVKDDGEGFRGDRKYLGEIFHRGSASHGTGVGLYLVKTLCRRMGVKVGFEAGPGFKVTMGFRGSDG